MALAGAQNVLTSQATWFHEKGYDVTIAYFYDKQELEAIWRSKYPFKIINLHAWNARKSGPYNFITLCVGMVKLFNLMRANKYDLIETFTSHSNILGLPVAWLTGIPVRIGSHHGKIEDSASWLLRLHGKIINSGIAICLIAVSNQVKEYAVSHERVKEKKVKVILNGIELPNKATSEKSRRMDILNELGLNTDNKLILSVGRLTRQKGQSYLVDAIPYVVEKFPSATFVFAGDGYLLSDLEKKSKKLKIESNLHFIGLRTDIADLLIAADIFVLPSLSEGLPISLLEAMSVGLPVVATQVGGIEDVIENEIGGLVIPPKNFPSLATAIIRLLENPDEAEKMGRIGREQVYSRYTVGQMCQSYEDLFLHFLSETIPHDEI